MQCPFVRLVEVLLREGRALGSGPLYEHSWGVSARDQNGILV
jgi:hypothetical protein